MPRTYAEVRLPLTDQDLAFIELPDAAAISATGSADGPEVSLSAVTKGRLQSWQARIVRTEGVVDENSRVTYAVARIRDPYALASEPGTRAPLPMGTFVAADIAGVTVSDVVRIPRTALRANNQLMIVDDDNKLRISNVEILRADAQYAYLKSGAVAGDRISLTTIESPLNGMLVRTERDSGDAATRIAEADAN